MLASRKMIELDHADFVTVVDLRDDQGEAWRYRFANLDRNIPIRLVRKRVEDCNNDSADTMYLNWELCEDVLWRGQKIYADDRDVDRLNLWLSVMQYQLRQNYIYGGVMHDV